MPSKLHCSSINNDNIKFQSKISGRGVSSEMDVLNTYNFPRDYRPQMFRMRIGNCQNKRRKVYVICIPARDPLQPQTYIPT